MRRGEGPAGGVVADDGLVVDGVPAAEAAAIVAAPPTTAPAVPTALPLPAALLILALAFWTVDVVSPALPVIRDDLALDATGAGLVAAAFFGGRLVSNLPASLLVDRVGPRPTAIVGGAVLGAGSIAAALAGAFLLPARALQGTGVAMLATAALLSVLRARPGGGAAMTAFNLAVGVGGSVALFVSGPLTAALGWRGIFWVSGLLAAVMLGIAVAVRPNQARGRTPTVPEPFPAKQARWSAAVVAAMAANLLVYGNYAVWIVALPLYAAARFAADPARIGLLLLAINTVHLVGAIPVGGVIKRAGPIVTLAAGLALSGLGMAMMAAAPSEAWLSVPIALYALGQVAGNSAAGDLLLRLGGRDGRAVGRVRLTSDVGMVIGPAAAGMLVDALGVRSPFVALAALSAVGAAIAAAAWRWRGTTASAAG